MQPSKPNNIIAFGLRSMATAHLAKLDDRCTVLRGILLEQHPGVTKQAIASEIVGVLHQRGVICKSPREIALAEQTIFLSDRFAVSKSPRA